MEYMIGSYVNIEGIGIAKVIENGIFLGSRYIGVLDRDNDTRLVFIDRHKIEILLKHKRYNKVVTNEI